MQQEVTILEIDWSESFGPGTLVGSPYLFGWLRAAYVQPGLISDGRVVVVARKNPSADWVQYEGPVSQTDAESLLVAFAVMGVPERAPQVQPIPDSSDTWFTSSVRVVVGQETQTFTIQTQSSGFQGQEAEGLREIFQRILDLSGYGNQHTIFGSK